MDNQMDKRENYLKINVPIGKNAKWYKALKSKAGRCPYAVDWERNFHITVLYAYDAEKVDEMKVAFARVLHAHKAITLKLDKLDAFEAHKEQIIHITSTQPSPDFTALKDDLRNAAINLGANIRRDFILHITLGKVDKAAATIDQVKSLTSSIDMPAFDVCLRDVEYKYKGSQKSIGKWHLNNN